MTMSGVKKVPAEIAEIKPTMKVNKKELDPIEAAEALRAEKEKKKAELQRQLAAEEAEMDEIEQKIAQKRAEKAEAERKEKEDEAAAALVEETWFLEKARESKEKRKKIEAELGLGVEDKPVYDAAVERVKEAIDSIPVIKVTDQDNGGRGHNADQVFMDELKTEKELPEEYRYKGSEHIEQEETGFWGRVKKFFRPVGYAWKKGIWPFLKKLLPFVQIGALALFLFVSWAGFRYYENKIERYNASLSNEDIITKKVNAYNDANIQRMFFESMNIGWKIALCFGLLFIISPAVITYIVPFLKGKVNLIDDFINAEGWVRLLFFAVLLFIVLDFLGKTAVVNTF